MEKRSSLIGMIEQLPDSYLDELFTIKYVSICTDIQRKGPAIATTGNRAKPSAEELAEPTTVR